MEPGTATPTRADRSADQAEQGLLARVVERDQDAYERLYRRYYRPLARFVLRIVEDRDVVEEVVNDVMALVWRKAESFEGRSKVSTWIFGIAYRKALKERARRRRGPEIVELDEAVTVPSTQDSGAETIFLKTEVARALARLPVAQRTVMELTYFHGYQYGEIAEIVGCPEGTVKTRMFHARTKLKAILLGQEQVGT